MSCRIVICDDNQAYCTTMAVVLGFDPRFEVVAQAGNGAEAIEACREHQPDLVLLDIAMPVMDGFAALPRIREVSPSSRILMNSAFLQSAVARKAHERGAHGYLEKGVELRALLDTLERACSLEPGERL